MKWSNSHVSKRYCHNLTCCTIFIESQVQRVLNLHGTLSFTIRSVTKIERWEMLCAELNVWGLNGCLTGKLFSLIRWKSISEQDKFWSTKLLNCITLSLSHSKLIYTKWFYSRKCSFQNISPSASEADMKIRSRSIQLYFALRKLCRIVSIIWELSISVVSYKSWDDLDAPPPVAWSRERGTLRRPPG